MKGIARFLPSGKFASTLGALLGSAALILGVAFTTGYIGTPKIGTLEADQTSGKDWHEVYDAIQTANASTSLPSALSDQDLGGLLASASSSNVTDAVSRSLFIQIANSSSQGMGADAPTQTSLVQNAVSKINESASVKKYVLADLTTEANSKELAHTYGNAVMQASLDNPGANAQNVYLAIGLMTDNNDDSQKAKLTAYAKAYRALAEDLRTTPVPNTLAPIHLSIVNDYFVIADATDNLALALTDPIQALAGLQRFRSALDEENRLYTQVNTGMRAIGVTFADTEPGAAWNQLSATNK